MQKFRLRNTDKKPLTVDLKTNYGDAETNTSDVEKYQESSQTELRR